MTKSFNTNGTNLHLTKITRATSKTSVTPRIAFNADWLREMGFVHDALAQYLPERGGCSFILLNENIDKDNALCVAEENRGTLVRVRTHRNLPQIVISGFYVTRAELTHGDILLARYEHGLIRMRKVPGGAVKVVTAHLVGKWLEELGFVPDECFTIAIEPGSIVLRLWENGRERVSELVKFVRANKLKLLQVQKMRNGALKTNSPCIDLPPSCLEKAGFPADCAFLAVYEYGLIQLQKLDFDALGF